MRWKEQRGKLLLNPLQVLRHKLEMTPSAGPLRRLNCPLPIAHAFPRNRKATIFGHNAVFPFQASPFSIFKNPLSLSSAIHPLANESNYGKALLYVSI